MKLGLILVSLFVLTSPWHGGDEQEQTSEKDSAPRNVQPSPSALTVVDKNSSEEKTATPTVQSKNDPDKSPWGDVPTWGLVFVGIAGAGIAIYTLRDIKRQTDALVTAGRSWIMVDVEKVPGMGGIMDGSRTEMGVGPVHTESTAFRARINCRNDGKTPAWITGKSACLDIVELIPEIPDWGRTQPIQVEPEPISAGQIGKPKDETLICKRGREEGKRVIVYGIVKYRDPLGDNRSTTFRYEVRDDGTLERLTQPKYNENA